MKLPYGPRNADVFDIFTDGVDSSTTRMPIDAPQMYILCNAAARSVDEHQSTATESR